MCGVIGAFGPSAKDLFSRIETATDAIKHRGPDAAGHFLSDDQLCALGHTRLSILDLSPAGRQPMTMGSTTLCYNGEIYDHLTLREELGPYNYKGTSDTETLLLAYDQRGKDLFDGRQGMYAGTFYDSSKKSLLLFRDPLGIKPLYLSELQDGTLVFGSEIPAILALAPQISRDIDLDCLSYYLAYENYAQGPTIYKNIRLLQPGELIEATFLNDGNKVAHSQHTIAFSPSPEQFSYNEVNQKLFDDTEAAIRKSVKAHLLSDVPVGVYLSGGYDSSLVATIAAQESSARLKGFTGYFETQDSYYDETPISQAVANKAEIDLKTVPITCKDFEDNFDDVVRHIGSPRMGMGSFSQYMVSKVAGQEVKVILSGHGGDELFAGYNAFKAFFLFENGILSSDSRSAMKNISPKALAWVANAYRQKWFKPHMSFVPQFQKPDWLERPEPKGPFVAPVSYKIADLFKYYLETYLPGLLVVEDTISMAHSLETRMPLWNQEFISFALSISPHLKLHKGEQKFILKKIARKLLPEEVLKGPKRGFPTPLQLWLKKDLKDWAQARLLDSPCTQFYELVPRTHTEKLLKQATQTQPIYSLDAINAHRVWQLLNLESWFRQSNNA